MKKMMLLTGVLAFLLFSCDGDLTGTGGNGGNTDPPETKTFKALNWKTNEFYTLSAELLAEGTHCKIWVEKGSGVTKEIAEKVKNEYDSNVYTKMINTFGANNEGFSFADELADINSAEGGKLIILLLNIKDNYQKDVDENAVGGYFLWSDLFPAEDGSNGLAMIYIDTNPGVPGEAASNKTLAHEMQHLMNEVTSQVLRYNDATESYAAMDTWIDEGLSAAAEWVYSGTHSSDRVNWYNYKNTDSKIKSLINDGNNFFVWGNRKEESGYAEQDDYATTYLFFQWLRIQSSKGTGIYKDIIGSNNSGYSAVTAAFGDNWGNLLRDWLAANYINDTSASGTNSRYGYKNDATLKNITKHYFAGTDDTKTTPLYPGEGVFSNIDAGYVAANTNKPTDTTNIKYTILTNAPGNTMAVGALLTYNVNTSNIDDSDPDDIKFPTWENGTVTGGTASISVDVSVDGRFVSPPVILSGPFWVSGGDVLRRNGRVNLSPAGVPRPLIRVSR